jgi:hypothetical protein
MATSISSLRTNRDEPNPFTRLTTDGQISPAAQYALLPEESQFTKGLRTTAAALTAGSYTDEALSKEAAGDPAYTDALNRATQVLQDTRMYAPRVSSLRDVHSLGDAGDYAASALGQGAMSMVPMIPTLAAAALTRNLGLVGKAIGHGVAAVPMYDMGRGAAALEQYQDPEQMKAPVQDRETAARARGVIDTAFASAVPIGIGKTLLQKPAGSLLGHIGREAAIMGATGGAQRVADYGTEKYIDPNKQLDPWDVADAVAGGALTGGAMSGVFRGPAHAAAALLGRGKDAMPDMSGIKNPFQRGDDTGDGAGAGGVADMPNEGGGGGAAAGPAPADTVLDKMAGFGQAVKERFGDDFAAAGDKAKDVTGKAKDIVSDTLDRMTEAVRTAENPGDFLSKVFGTSLEDEASADAFGQPKPTLKGGTIEETEANVRHDDEQRATRASRYADELLNDPVTPDEVKQRVVDMGGDFTDPDNQSFLARTLVTQRGGEKAGSAVKDLIDLDKSVSAKGSEIAGDATDGAQDRVVKKNLQSATPAEEAAFSKVVFDGLTDEAKASPDVRRHLSDVTNAMMAFAAKTGDVTAKDLPTLTKLSNAMSLFKDPDAMAKTLVEYANLPRPEDSFLSRIKSITNAQQDMKQPNSFLVSSLTPEARRQLTAPQLQRIAQLVDQFTLIDSADSKKGTALVNGLASAFGSPESAKAVLDYYAKQNKADLRFDPNETLQEDGSNPINVHEAPEASYQFKDAKSMRPFSVLRGTQRGAKESSRAAVDMMGSGSVGPDARAHPVPYSEYVARTGRDPGAEVRRIANDIKERIAGHESRTGEDRSQQINELKGELSAMREAYKKGGAKAALDLYEVLKVSDAKAYDGTIASDEDVAAYGKLTKDPSASKTRVTFERTDGSKLTLSAESMWKSQGDKEGSGRGEGASRRMRRLFSDAVASVLARDDVKGLSTNLDDVVLDRKTGARLKPERDDEYYDMVKSALKGAEGSLKELEGKLSEVADEFTELLDDDSGVAESRRAEIKLALQRNVDRLQERLNELKKNRGGVPAETVVKKRLRMYTEAAANISALEFEHEVEQSDMNRKGVTGEDDGKSIGSNGLPRTRSNEELNNTSPRRYEEDTGAALGSTRAPMTGAGGGSKNGDARPLSPKELTTLHDVAVKGNWDRIDTPEKMQSYKELASRAIEELGQIPEDRLTRMQRGLLDKLRWGASPPSEPPSESPKKDVAYKNKVELTGDSPYLGKDQEKSDRADKFIGRGSEKSSTNQYMKDWGELANTGKYTKDDTVFISAEGNRKGRIEPDWNEIKKAVDAGATLITDAKADRGRQYNVGEREVAKFLSDNGYAESSPGTWAPVQREGRAETPKTEPNPAASSRETAKKIDDTRALSPDALTDLYDVAVKDNWGRLDTPGKVLRFTDMAVKAFEQLKKIPALDLTDTQSQLRFRLEELLDPKGSFDWGSMWDGLEPTDAQRARLEELIRPKAEPGSARQSAMNPNSGEPGKIDKQAIIDEIARIRGKDVKVAFAKFADIGASGEFSMSPDKTKRLIKIAVDSLNPMSVAWHESLHDFMAVLGGSKAERKLKADLLAASEAPQVMSKMRELLKDHPEALMQIEKDREERLAYMYQFWAEGALKLGPTGTNIFSRIVTFFREMLGVLSQDQKIDRLLTALHGGKFSEPSLVGAVLEDLKAETLPDRIRRVSGPLGDTAEALFTATTDRLRNTNVEALTELADMFHREPGREAPGKLPFMQRRAQQTGKRLNQLQDILGDTSAEDRRRALENMQAMKPPSSPLEMRLAAYLKDIHDYMVENGVKRFDHSTKKWEDLGYVKNYFPRVWDKGTIRNNEAEFVKLLEQYVGKEQARETFNALVNGDGSIELAENEHSLGFTPWNPSVLDRRFTFIDPSNAGDFAKYQSKDLVDVMTTYAQRAVHRAEYANDFGNDGEVITSKLLKAQKQGATQDELDMARKATMAMEGTLGYNFNPHLKEVMSGLMAYENIVLLPLSLFSNLIDPLGIALRSNDMKEAWTAFKYGIKGLVDQVRGAGPDAQTEMARTLGLIGDQLVLDSMGQMYNSMYMSKFLKNLNTKFFRYNGMERWNQNMRVAAMVAAQRFILANLGHERYLSELGITDSDVFQLEDGRIALTKDQLLQAGARKEEVSAIEKRIQAAVFKWVDGAVLRPNAAHRPIWGSDPRYQLIFHLKQYTYSFQNTILRRVNEELKHGNVMPAWILMSYVPFMFASDAVKGLVTGTLHSSADLYSVASQSLARSGILGTGVFGEDAWGDLKRGKLPGTTFLGPTFDHLMTLLSGLTGHASMGQVVDRSVPLAKYI